MLILGEYQINSWLYGSNRQDSDIDKVLIIKEYTPDLKDIDKNISVYDEANWFMAGHNHDIKFLECLYCPEEFIIVPYRNFNFQLVKGKLRESISTTSSHSWVKGKKKLIVSNDYDKIAGIKSIFHSIRILDFGTQIANTSKIYNFQSMKWLAKELYLLAEKYERDTLWDKINSRYLGLYKNLRSDIKELIPKNQISHVDKKEKLGRILTKHGIKNNRELMKDIMELYE